jgi:hypothetical protein
MPDDAIPSYSQIATDGTVTFAPPGYVRDGSGALRSFEILGQFEFPFNLPSGGSAEMSFDIGVDASLLTNFVPLGAPSWPRGQPVNWQDALTWGYGLDPLNGALVQISIRNDSANPAQGSLYFFVLIQR